MVSNTAQSTSNNKNDITKSKRGRKSKKELIETLQNSTFSLLNDNPNINKLSKNNSVNLTVTEIQQPTTDNIIQTTTTEFEITNNNDDDSNHLIDVIEEPKIAKKRGRKPKGGKIVQQFTPLINDNKEKHNIILHLKCSMKDLQTNGQISYDPIESYNLLSNKHELNYEVINKDNNIHKLNDTTIISNNYNNNENDDENDNDDIYDNDDNCKDNVKEIWKKIKQLEYNLHINNVNNKRSCCF